MLEVVSSLRGLMSCWPFLLETLICQVGENLQRKLGKEVEEETLNCSLVEEGGNLVKEQQQAAIWALPSLLEVTVEPHSVEGVSEVGAQWQVVWEERGTG